MAFRKICIADRLAGNEHMACAVEAVAADFVFVIILFRDRITVSIRLKAHAECGIENSDIGLAGHSCFAGLDAHQVCRIVQRPEVEALADHFLDIIVDLDGFRIYGTAVEHAMADRVDFVDG